LSDSDDSPEDWDFNVEQIGIIEQRRSQRIAFKMASKELAQEENGAAKDHAESCLKALGYSKKHYATPEWDSLVKGLMDVD